MISALKITLLGVALAAANPIAYDAALSQEIIVRLADILPDGMAPFYMAQYANPAAEFYLNKGCPHSTGVDCVFGNLRSLGFVFDDIIKRLRAANPNIHANSTVTVINLPPEANEIRNASAATLILRQEANAQQPADYGPRFRRLGPGSQSVLMTATTGVCMVGIAHELNTHETTTPRSGQTWPREKVARGWLLVEFPINLSGYMDVGLVS